LPFDFARNKMTQIPEAHAKFLQEIESLGYSENDYSSIIEELEENKKNKKVIVKAAYEVISDFSNKHLDEKQKLEYMNTLKKNPDSKESLSHVFMTKTAVEAYNKVNKEYLDMKKELEEYKAKEAASKPEQIKVNASNMNVAKPPAKVLSSVNMIDEFFNRPVKTGRYEPMAPLSAAEEQSIRNESIARANKSDAATVLM
jgi:uncharacterized protein (DUF1778 family)